MDGLVKEVQKGSVETLLILENDIYRRLDKKTAHNLFSKVKHVVAFDYLENTTTSAAEVVIPVGTFAEADGTLVNNEGRAQRFYQSFPPEGVVQESWRWMKEIMDVSNKDDAKSWNNLSDIVESVEKEYSVFNGIQSIAPPPGFRIAGQKIPRQSHRYSGRTAMKANINVHEQKPPDDPDSPLTFTMEGFFGEPPSPLIPRFWSPGWNSVQSINKYQIEVGGSLHGGDPGKRLIEPAENVDILFYKKIPGAFKARSNEWQFIPIHHIFGSEELSVISPAVKERSPDPYICLNPEDAKGLKVKGSDKVKLNIDGENFDLAVKFEKTLPKGLAGFPVGFPEVNYCELPVWGIITGAGK